MRDGVDNYSAMTALEKSKGTLRSLPAVALLAPITDGQYVA